MGPAVGIDPVCAVEAVCAAYAAGPASAISTPAIPSAVATRGGSAASASSATATTSPETTTVGASQDCHEPLRPSSTYAQAAVVASVAARTTAGTSWSRRSHISRAPMATSAPIAGPSATV